MGKFEDLLDLLFADDDDEDVTVEVHVIGGDTEEPEEPKGKHEEPPKTEDAEDKAPSTDEEKEMEELYKKAKAQHDEIVGLIGADKAKSVVKFASHCAMLTSLVGDGIPLDQKMVDEYNSLCEEIHPERCTPLMKTLAYAALRLMAKEGEKSLGC